MSYSEYAPIQGYIFMVDCITCVLTVFNLYYNTDVTLICLDSMTN